MKHEMLCWEFIGKLKESTMETESKDTMRYFNAA